jgi:hypothetical protein
MKKEIF